ncbi:YdcF family protein [Clostridium amazonitimonense]|uniref:YdcF family protein n=1 Tax=Clostridium amazonitimonense TaxID=1499689 RepID=UPI000B1D82D3|nr:YdcF family protein [Clostridium amazonitimonense]
MLLDLSYFLLCIYGDKSTVFMYLYIFFILISILLIGILLLERRSLWSGFGFLIWAGTSLAVLAILGDTYETNILFIIVLIITGIIIIGFPFYLMSFIFALFATAFKLIKREGGQFRNFLSLFLGIFLVTWVFIIPFFIDKITDPIWQGIFAFISFGTTYFFFVMLCFAIASWLNLVPIPFRKYDYIIVLGSGLMGRRVTPLLASRIDKGIQLFQRYNTKERPVKLIFTGGQGEDEEISEGDAMASYAMDKGIQQENIIIEDKAVDTYENMLFSKGLIQEDVRSRGLKGSYRCIIVTNNFHVFRSLLWARKVELKCDGAGSKTKFYFWLNALIREFIGVLYMQKNFHIFVLVLAAIISTALTFINIYFVLPR